jgi:hypothetical protein
MTAQNERGWWYRRKANTAHVPPFPEGFLTQLVDEQKTKRQLAAQARAERRETTTEAVSE